MSSKKMRGAIVSDMTTTKGKRPRRPGDFTQRAKFIGDLATGQITQEEIDALPPMGKEIGGHARNKAVPLEQRIANGRKGGHAKARNRAARLANQQT